MHAISDKHDICSRQNMVAECDRSGLSAGLEYIVVIDGAVIADLNHRRLAQHDRRMDFTVFADSCLLAPDNAIYRVICQQSDQINEET